MNWLYKFYEDLKRRNVLKAGISYMVVSWVLLQVIALLGDILNSPDWINQYLLISLLFFLPIWLIISWYYEITPEGLKRTANVPIEKSVAKKTGQQLNKVIILFLSLALTILVVDRFFIAERVKTKTIATYNVPKQRQSIAVLPFSDFSQNKDQEYFGEGLSEELLNLLAKIQDLKVTSRTSSFSFKNSDLPLSEIGKLLDVNFVLEGSIRKAEDQLRITVQLISASTDKHIWSETYNRKFENILLIQDQVAKAVVDALQVKLQISEEGLTTQKTDPKVYALYLKAKHQFYLKDNESLLRAEGYLLQAIALDDAYVPSKLLLTKIYQLQGNYGIKTYKNAHEKAIAIIEDVLKNHPDNALANALRGDIYLSYEWNYKKAETFSNKALALEPTNAEIVDYAATLATSLGYLDKAIRLHEYSVSLDPINPNSYYSLANTYYTANRLADAEKAIEKAIELDPDGWALNYTYSRILVHNNKPVKALEALEKETDEGWRLNALALIYYKMGDIKGSDEQIARLIEKFEKEMPYQIAQIYAFRNEKDLAFKWLERAYNYHDIGLNEVLKEPEFNNLHKDSRWNTFLRKMGFLE